MNITTLPKHLSQIFITFSLKNQTVQSDSPMKQNAEYYLIIDDTGYVKDNLRKLN